ncbi:hypothetical protein [Flavobacterium cerinum]|uniref:Uncharacterized protein n=1 Tax=Flavobacterium cerinum TaxID=2502784 RepID=A0A3S3QMY1_9FLAO|nr:hypothetical protein [Flavobacterium cerinum]RWX03649.1 hypothetical protein EPI11_01610 [Flavobacterium cerinum]
MKRFFLIIVLFSLQVYSQKKLEIYNLTNQTVTITDIFTNASGTYPEFHCKGTMIAVPASGSYILENTSSLTRFPFDSPATSPYIASWQRQTSATMEVFVPSTVAWTLGSPQSFYRMTFNVGNFGYSISAANSPFAGPGFTAEYSMFTNGTVVIYTVVIY